MSQFKKFKFLETGISQGDFDVAAAYCDGDMLDDTISLLQDRYPESQNGTSGDSIQAICIPLMARFLDEAANIYSTGVEARELVNDEGVVDEDTTKAYNEHLEEIAFDHTKAAQERYTIGLGSSVIYYEGNPKQQLSGQIYLPQDITPVLDKDGKLYDKGDVDAYEGFSIAMRDPDLEKEGRDRYSLVTPTTLYSYEAKIGQPDQPTNLTQATNPYGIQTLSVWGKGKAIRQLLPSAVPSIFIANRELNILWSMIMDIIRFQGGGTLIKSLINPEEAGARAMSGVRFPSIVSQEEAVNYINSANDYAGLTTALVSFMRLIALANRLSPSDFSLEGSQVASGFAKIMDSLPKIEGRRERVEWYQIMERNDWPRQAAVLINEGVLSESARALKLRTTFKEPEIPRSVDEDIKAYEHEFKWGLSSPIEVIMGRDGVDREEAIETLTQNKEDVALVTNQGSNPLNLLSQDKGLRENELTNLIGAKDAEDQKRTNSTPPRPDRPKRSDEAGGSLDRAESLQDKAERGNGSARANEGEGFSGQITKGLSLLAALVGQELAPQTTKAVRAGYEAVRKRQDRVVGLTEVNEVSEENKDADKNPDD